MELWQLLKIKRIMLGLSEAELAERVEGSDVLIRLLEADRYPEPRADLLRCLAEALEINYVEVLIAANYVRREELEDWLKKAETEAVPTTAGLLSQLKAEAPGAFPTSAPQPTRRRRAGQSSPK